MADFEIEIYQHIESICDIDYCDMADEWLPDEFKNAVLFEYALNEYTPDSNDVDFDIHIAVMKVVKEAILKAYPRK